MYMYRKKYAIHIEQEPTKNKRRWQKTTYHLLRPPDTLVWNDHWGGGIWSGGGRSSFTLDKLISVNHILHPYNIHIIHPYYAQIHMFFQGLTYNPSHTSKSYIHMFFFIGFTTLYHNQKSNSTDPDASWERTSTPQHHSPNTSSQGIWSRDGAS